MLVFQPTGHVVWAAIEPNINAVMPKRIPWVCPELDYRIHRGSLPDQYWANLRDYKLIKPDWSLPGIDYGPVPAEFQVAVKLMRAKCYASANIATSVRVYQERKALIENPLLDTRLDITAIGNIYAKQHNLNYVEGLKLARFKIDELLSLQTHIQVTQIESELALESAQTVDQVVELYRVTQLGLGMHNAFDITKML